MTPTRNPAVDAFMAELEHPLKVEIEAVRVLVLGLEAGVTEGIKWKAPSFRTPAPTGDDFATLHLRTRDSVQVILHLGAKVRPDRKEIALDDPRGLLKTLAWDRRLASLGAGEVFEANRDAFAIIVRQWMAHV